MGVRKKNACSRLVEAENPGIEIPSEGLRPRSPLAWTGSAVAKGDQSAQCERDENAFSLLAKALRFAAQPS